MKISTLFVFVFCFVSNIVNGQPCTDSSDQPPGCIYKCSYFSGGGNASQMADSLTINSTCNQVDYTEWLSVVAANNSIKIITESNTCSSQIVYDLQILDSSFNPVSACNNIDSNNPADTLIASNLTIGNTYHILWNTPNGGCSYDILIEGHDTIALGATPDIIVDPSSEIFGGKLSIPLVNGAHQYIWTSTQGSFVTSGQGTNEVTFNNSRFDSQICVTPKTECGTSGTIKCISLPLFDCPMDVTSISACEVSCERTTLYPKDFFPDSTGLINLSCANNQNLIYARREITAKNSTISFEVSTTNNNNFSFQFFDQNLNPVSSCFNETHLGFSSFEINGLTQGARYFLFIGIDSSDSNKTYDLVFDGNDHLYEGKTGIYFTPNSDTISGTAYIDSTFNSYQITWSTETGSISSGQGTTSVNYTVRSGGYGAICYEFWTNDCRLIENCIEVPGTNSYPSTCGLNFGIDVGGTNVSNSPPGCFSCIGIYSGYNIGYSSTTVFNFECGITHNNVFMTVISDSIGEISLTILTSNCHIGEGLQVALYDKFLRPVSDCSNPFGAPSSILQASGLDPTERYFLMLDGYNGDICDFTVINSSVDNTFSQPQDSIFTPPIIATPFQSSYCTKDTVLYSINSVPEAAIYTWNIPPFAKIINGGSQSDTSVLVEFIGDGLSEINVSADKLCSVSNPSSITIEVFDSPSFTHSTIYACPSEFPLLINGNSFNSIGTFDIIHSLNQDCDSIETYIIEGIDIPETPIRSTWTSPICLDQNYTYEVTNYDTTNQINWSVTGGTIVSGATTDIIEINWNLVPEGIICINYANQCGISNTLCDTITLIPIPTSDFVFDKTDACIGEVVTVTFQGNASSNAIFNWNFGSANIVSGSGSGPYELTFPTHNNNFQISLDVTDNGCVSSTTTKDIDINQSIGILTINCDINFGEIIFSWDSVIYATDYQVDVLTGQNGTQNGNTFTVSSLSPSEEVEINVTATGPTGCLSSSRVKSCITQQCGPNSIVIDPVAPICEDHQPIQLLATVANPGNGSITWTGDGVTTDGIFDPSLVSFYGSVDITATYSENGCDYSETINIEITESFNTSIREETFLCSGVELAFTNGDFTGPTAIYEWDVSPGRIVSNPDSSTILVVYDTSGFYKVHLTITEGGCTGIDSSEFSVRQSPVPFDIDCAPMGSEIVFTWPNVQGADTYVGEVLSGQTGRQNNLLTYTVSNLSLNEEVTLQVTALENFGPCPHYVVEKTCFATECQPIDVAITPIDICLERGTSPVQLTATTTSSNNGTFSWSGNDITSDGIFNPYTAGVGNSNITVVYTENGCTYNSTSTIIVDQGIEDFLINCNSTLDEVVFDWPEILGANNFQVNVLSGQTGTLNGRTYTVSGLLPNEEVIIEVTAISAFTSCSEHTETMTCSAADCPQVNVLIDPVPLVCLQPNTPPIQLQATTDQPGSPTGIFVWSGDHITPDGIFDPVAAGVGNFQYNCSYSENHCEYEVSGNIEIEPAIFPFLINCNASLDEVTFDWAEVSGAIGYQPIVLTGQVGTQIGRTFTVSGLSPNEEVILAVTAFGDGSCPAFTAQQACKAADCPTVSVNIDPVSSICLTGNNNSIQLNASVSGASGNGNLVWSGNGVNATGLFNPTIAGVGSSTINITYSENGCDYATSTTIEIFGIPSNDFIAPSEACTGEPFSITYNGNASPNAIYNWNFDGATILSGSGRGPYSLLFNDEENYDLSLLVEDNGCSSQLQIKDLVVRKTPEPFTVNCTSTLNEINFSWPQVAGAINYNVEVLTGQTGTRNGTTFQVSNLSPNEEVIVRVTALGDSNCADATAQQTCSAQNCPPNTVTIDPINPICLNFLAVPIQLTASVLNGNGNFTWSGNGINANGIFNPIQAGVGISTIKVTYTENGCDYSGNYNVIVNPAVSSDFTVTSPVCQNEEAIVTYTGNAGSGADFDWNFLNAAIQSGSGRGPFSVVFPTPGNFDISLLASENNCSDIPSSQTIEVQPLLQQPIVSCNSGTTFINFSWPPVNGAFDYSINILTPGLTVTSRSDFSIRFDNLSPDQEVSIEVTALSNSACPSSSTTFSCKTQSCPNIPFEINPISQPICEDDDMIIQATLINGGSFPGCIWGGDISPTGEIDPSLLGPGNYSANISCEINGCIFSDTLSYTIFEKPQISATESNPIWGINSTGRIETTVQNGTPPYRYNWSNNNSSSEIAKLFPGEYCVTVTDANECETQECYNIEGLFKVPPLLLICRGDEEIIPITPSFGADFQWSPALNLSCNNCPAPVVKGSKSQSYQVIAELPDGKRDTTNVYVFVLPNALCFGNFFNEIDPEKLAEEIKINDLSSIEEVEEKILELLEEEIILYPNPTRNEVTIQSSSSVESTIVYDINGKEILKSTESTINLGNQKAGVYLFKVKTQKGQYTKRLILIK